MIVICIHPIMESPTSSNSEKKTWSLASCRKIDNNLSIFMGAIFSRCSYLGTSADICRYNLTIWHYVIPQFDMDISSCIGFINHFLGYTSKYTLW